MCWNASISINTYIFSTFATIFAYANQIIDIYSLVFLQSLFIMQLLEYFVWSKTFPNQLLSKVGLFIIILQPVFSILRMPSSNIYREYLLGIYALFVIVLYTILTPWNKIDFSTIPHKNGHLAWNWIPSNEIAIIWVLFLLLPSYINGWYRGVFIGGVIFTITFSLYSDTKTWGSLWCWFSNIIGLFLIIYVFEKDLCIKKHWISSLRNMFPANFSLDFVR